MVNGPFVLVLVVVLVLEKWCCDAESILQTALDDFCPGGT